MTTVKILDQPDSSAVEGCSGSCSRHVDSYGYSGSCSRSDASLWDERKRCNSVRKTLKLSEGNGGLSWVAAEGEKKELYLRAKSMSFLELDLVPILHSLAEALHFPAAAA